MKRKHANVRLEHGRPLKATVGIDVPADEVWAVIAEPGGLAHYHPFCAATEVERWPGTGSRDSITYYSGIRYRRNFVSWQEGVGYDIELGDPPNQTARVRWSIEPTSRRTCRLSIEVVPLLRSDLSEEKKRAYQERLFGDVQALRGHGGYRQELPLLRPGVKGGDQPGQGTEATPPPANRIRVDGAPAGHG